MIKRLLVILVLFTTSLAYAQRCDRMIDVLPLIDQDTLVIFDIHNTLMRPTQQLGTHKWARYLYHQLTEQGMSPENARDETARRLMLVVSISDMQPVEPSTPNLVRDLQDAGVEVMALTGSPGSFSDVVPGQLLGTSIDLSRTAPAEEDFELDLPGVKYENGILYGAGHDKGEVLKGFLSLSGLRPNRVVYVDDRVREVDRVRSALDDLEIESIGVCYDAALKLESPIEPEVVELQWQMLGKVLSDAQARAILQQNGAP